MDVGGPENPSVCRSTRSRCSLPTVSVRLGRPESRLAYAARSPGSNACTALELAHETAAKLRPNCAQGTPEGPRTQRLSTTGTLSRKSLFSRRRLPEGLAGPSGRPHAPRAATPGASRSPRRAPKTGRIGSDALARTPWTLSGRGGRNSRTKTWEVLNPRKPASRGHDPAAAAPAAPALRGSARSRRRPGSRPGSPGPDTEPGAQDPDTAQTEVRMSLDGRRTQASPRGRPAGRPLYPARPTAPPWRLGTATRWTTRARCRWRRAPSGSPMASSASARAR